MDYAKNNNHSQVVFVTNDAKEDWWLRLNASGEQITQPRPELIDEALHRGGIESFLMYDSEKFLKYSAEYMQVKVSDSSVKEVGDTNRVYQIPQVKIQFKNSYNNRQSIFEKALKMIAYEKVEEFQKKLESALYGNKGILDYQSDILNCPECGERTMIPNMESSTGYQCT